MINEICPAAITI